ncbi:MAG TPA: hypothetical protein D7I00_06610 [Candidatus Poseidoniales archaeon]|nr:MAG TPA: hypothetical protein D7I00_06610 [Candidatus Poseidoniales archaeon]HII25401.1 hypothetical protein [Candidatus Poseidoniaceae archaeon]
MGLEIVVLLVDVPSLRQLLETPWLQLYSGLEQRTLRANRPQQDARMKVNFDIDAEAELLDWMDTQNRDEDDSTTFWSCLEDSGDGEKGLLLAMKWASPGAWEAWEGRAYMYLDVALSKTIEGEDELYGGETWDSVCGALKNLPEQEYAERVCLDWMERRKQLGETMDEKEDPRIVPTFEAHDRAAKSLVYAMTRWNNEGNLVAIIGRDHLEARKWGSFSWNLSTILANGVPDHTTASG